MPIARIKAVGFIGAAAIRIATDISRPLISCSKCAPNCTSTPFQGNLPDPLTPLISMRLIISRQWRTSCNSRYACPTAGKGWRLTTLFGSTTGIPVTAAVSMAPKKKRGSLLPLLTVVFIASYGLMTLLIVEQGATIQSQRNLIQVLQSDSTQFWAQKGKELHEKQMAQAETQRQNQSQTPLTHGQTQVQAPSTQTPSTQAVPQHHSQNHADKSAKPHT